MAGGMIVGDAKDIASFEAKLAEEDITFDLARGLLDALKDARAEVDDLVRKLEDQRRGVPTWSGCVDIANRAQLITGRSVDPSTVQAILACFRDFVFPISDVNKPSDVIPEPNDVDWIQMKRDAEDYGLGWDEGFYNGLNYANKWLRLISSRSQGIIPVTLDEFMAYKELADACSRSASGEWISWMPYLDRLNSVKSKDIRNEDCV